MKTNEEFQKDIKEAIKDKPKKWREGQFVFNYIDEMYGVAREVQFSRGIDCFYNDDLIDDFINESYQIFCKKQSNLEEE